VLHTGVETAGERGLFVCKTLGRSAASGLTGLNQEPALRRPAG
jgi:hypothetical protein